MESGMIELRECTRARIGEQSVRLLQAAQDLDRLMVNERTTLREIFETAAKARSFASEVQNAVWEAAREH